MKEICLIAAYTPTQQKEDALRNLVRKLKSFNKKILLITHSNNTPLDIISDVDYHFYDSESKYPIGDEYLPWYHITLGNKIIYSNDVIKKPTSILPVTRNLFFGLSISKILGYEFVHYIEYDCQINSPKLIDDNTDLLKDYDVIYYTIKKGFGDGEKHLYGPYSVYNLNSYTFDNLKWDENLILSEFKNVENNTLVEKVSQKILTTNKKCLIRDKEDLLNYDVNFDIIKSNTDLKIHSKILFIEDECFFVYSNNNSLIDESNIVILNNTEVIEFPVNKPGWFHVRNVGEVNKINNIKLYCNNEFIFEYDFSDPNYFDTFNKKNYIKNL